MAYIMESDMMTTFKDKQGNVHNMFYPSKTNLIMMTDENGKASAQTLSEFASSVTEQLTNIQNLLSTLSTDIENIQNAADAINTNKADINNLKTSLATANTNITNLQTALNNIDKVVTTTVATSSWTKPSGSSYYEATISDSSITSDMIINVYIDSSSNDVALAAGLLEITETGNGYVKIFSINVPSAAIKLSYQF